LSGAKTIAVAAEDVRRLQPGAKPAREGTSRYWCINMRPSRSNGLCVLAIRLVATCA
jgi:hypothetical protein